MYTTHLLCNAPIYVSEIKLSANVKYINAAKESGGGEPVLQLKGSNLLRP